MKKIVLIMNMLFCFHTLANIIEIDHVEYNVEKMGEFYFVNLANPTLSIKESSSGGHPKVSKVDCEEARGLVTRLERRIQRCEDSMESTSCRYAKETLKEYGTEIINLGEAPSQFFVVDYNLTGIEKEKNKIAKSLNVTMDKIITQTELSSNYEIENLTVSLGANSLMKQMKSLNIFEASYVHSYYYNQYLEISNRFLYCDFISGNAQLNAQIETEMAHTEIIDTETKDSGYRIYKGLFNHKIDPSQNKLIQAANLGFTIGDKLQAFKSQLTIKSIFESLVDTTHQNLEIKNFQSRSSFDENVFPNKIYEKRMSQKFIVKLDNQEF